MIDESINTYLLNKSPQHFNEIIKHLEDGDLPTPEDVDRIVRSGDILLIDSLGVYVDYTIKNITNNFDLSSLTDTEIEIIKSVLLHVVHDYEDDEMEIFGVYEAMGDKRFVVLRYFLGIIEYERFVELLEYYNDFDSIKYLNSDAENI